jgi:hypothetical protein
LAERHVELLLLGDAGPDRTQALGLEVWQKYLSFGSSIAYYWGDALNAQGASIHQMISTVQNTRKAA